MVTKGNLEIEREKFINCCKNKRIFKTSTSALHRYVQ